MERALSIQRDAALRREATASAKSRAGGAKSGTSRTSATGTARRNGVHEALRLRRRRRQARAADRAASADPKSPDPNGARTQQILRDFIEHCLARHQLRDRQDRIAARSHHLPRQGRAAAFMPDGHVRMGVSEPAARDRQRLRASSRRSRSCRTRRSSSASPIPKAAPRARAPTIRRTRIATARCSRATRPSSSRGRTSWPIGTA